jgi:hypothetical protein
MAALFRPSLYPVSVSVSLFSFQYNINIRRPNTMIQLFVLVPRIEEDHTNFVIDGRRFSNRDSIVPSREITHFS